MKSWMARGGRLHCIGLQQGNRSGSAPSHSSVQPCSERERSLGSVSDIASSVRSAAGVPPSQSRSSCGVSAHLQVDVPRLG
jgi:hypothetical protein